jgi:uncharacterized protein GlcG (DUF336 family)
MASRHDRCKPGIQEFLEMKNKMTKQTYLLRASVMVTIAAAIVALVPGSAWAQGATPAPLAKVVVSDTVAQRTLMKMVINADAARAIVDSCVNWTKQQPGNVSIAIFVLSPTGQVIDSHQMDGVLPIGAETGLMKAKTALYARGSSASVAQRFTDVDGRLIRLDLGKEQGLSYYFVGGGLPIVVDNNLIGAVGVGGGNADEMCAYQALQQVLGPQPPLATPAGRGAGGGAAAAPAAGGAGGGRAAAGAGAGGGRGGRGGRGGAPGQ